MAGLPGIDSLATYGGEKADYAPIEDPTTDESAEHRNIVFANVAAMTQTSCRAMRSFTGHATTPADPVSGFVHAAVWGSDNGVKPTVAHSATGIYDITWPTDVTDELGETHSVNLRRAVAQVEQSDGTFRDAHPKVTSANVVRVYTYSGTTLDDLVDEVITVWVY